MRFAVEKGDGGGVRDRRVRAPKSTVEATSRTSVGDALRSREAMTLDSAVTLQREAGNSAVVSLLERGGVAHTHGDQYPSERERNLQRDVLPAADDTRSLPAVHSPAEEQLHRRAPSASGRRPTRAPVGD
jgi:hypothetical protein